MKHWKSMALSCVTASGGRADRQALRCCCWVANGLHDNMATFPWAQALRLKDGARQNLNVQPKIVEKGSHGEESDV